MVTSNLPVLPVLLVLLVLLVDYPSVSVSGGLIVMALIVPFIEFAMAYLAYPPPQMLGASPGTAVFCHMPPPNLLDSDGSSYLLSSYVA